MGHFRCQMTFALLNFLFWGVMSFQSPDLARGAEREADPNVPTSSARRKRSQSVRFRDETYVRHRGRPTSRRPIVP